MARRFHLTCLSSCNYLRLYTVSKLDSLATVWR
nr:MAG TPA: hypothetical protein [Caudoviricetes sp.]